MRKLFCVLLLFGAITSVFAAGQYHKTYNNYEGDWDNALSWENGDGSLSNNDSIHIYGYIKRNTNLTLNNNIILRVYDTLVVYGDLYIENNGFLYVEAGGIVVVYGDVTADNNVNVDLSSYFVTLGNFTQNNNSDINAPDDDTLLYVTGTTTCNMATCLDDTLVGGMDDILDNPDISDLVVGISSIILPINPTICSGSSVDLYIRDDGTNYQWTLNGSTISGATSYTYTATVAGYYDVDFYVDGDPQDPGEDTVTVVASPVITNPGPQSACDSYTLPAIAGSNLSGSEAYFTGSGGTGTQYDASDVISATTTLYIYDINGSCSDEESFTITITDSPVITNPGPQSACDSYALPAIAGSNLSGSEAYFTGSGGTGTQYNASDVISATTTLYIYDINGSCSDEESFTITITDSPVITNPGPQSACDSYTLPAIAGSNLSGSEAYFTGLGGTGTQYDASDVISATTTLYIYDINGSCSDEESFTITITDSPVITNPGPQSACDSYTLPAIAGSNLSGSEAYFTGSGGTGTQYDASDVISATTTLYIYDINGSCSDEESFTITITDSPVITNPGPQSACDSYALPAIAGSNLSGNEAYFTGSGGTGTQYDASDVISATTTLYIYDINGSCSDEESFTITITDSPVITNPGPQSACDSYTLPAIAGSNLSGSEAYFTGSGGTGTQYNASDVISATTTLYIYDINGSCSDEESFTITITDSPVITNPGPQSACDSYTLPAIAGSNLSGSEAYFTGSGGTGTQYDASDVISATTTLYIYDINVSCSDEESFTITITDSPVITNPGPQSACDSYTLPAIAGSNLSGSEAYFTGSGGTGTQYDASDVISATTTLYIYDINGSCSDEESFTITITDSPVITNPGPQSACDSYALPAIAGSNLSGNEAYFTGSGGTGTQYDASDVISATTTLYIYDINGSCSDEESFTITITDSPVITNPGPQSACDSYTLPAIAGSNLSGSEAYFTGSGGTGTQYDASDVISATTTLYIYDINGSCSDEESFTITITDSPVITNPGPQSACDSYTLPAIAGSNLSGSEAYFTGSGGTGTQYDASDVISATTTLYIYDINGSCSDEESFTITITDSPVITNPGPQSACDSYTLPAIAGSNLSGSEAYFTGSGGTGTQYDASDVISATTTLYIYDINGSCSDEESFTITITDSPIITNPGDQTSCGDYTLLVISGSNLSGTEAYYTGPGGTGSTYAAGDVISSSTTPLYIYDSNGSCDDEVSFNINIISSITINNPGDQVTCDSYTLPTITGTNLTGSEAYYTGPGGTGTSYIAGAIITSSVSPMYIYDATGSCSDEESFTITITDTPIITNPGVQTVCDSYILPAITGSNLSGSEAYYTGSNGTGTSYAAGDVINSTTTLYIYDSNGSCSDEESFTITITDSPVITNPGPQSACDSYTLPAIAGSNLSGNEAYFTGSGGTGTQYDASDVISATTTLYIYDINGSCSDEESFTITIADSPVITNPGSQSACDSYTLPAIIGSNLSGSEAYYSGSGGIGTQYNAGDVISATTTLFIYDTNGSCSDEESFQITINNSLDIDDIADQSVCDSYVLPTITGNNLTGSEAYYSGTNGTGTIYSAGDEITNSITLYIYDAAGTCFDEEMFDVIVNKSANIDDIPNQTACDVYTLPVITGSNLSGNEAYYTGSNGTGTKYTSGENITNSMAMYIYDVNGNCSDEESFIITIFSTPDIYDIEDQYICDSYTLPVITGENLSGNESYYSSSGGTGDVYEVGEIVTSTTTLYIYDKNGTCSDEESFTINLRKAEVNLEENVEICEGEEYTFTTGILFNSYLWNNVSSESEYTTGEAGYVWVQVTNDYQCSASDTVYLTVNNNPIVNLGNDTLICGDESLIINAGEFTSYEWSTGDFSSSIQVYGGEQEISVTVTDDKGCMDSDTILIIDCGESTFGEITNVFTPNDDGVHDTWIINGIEMYPDAKIEVFDRSQRRVFFKSGTYSNSDAWDGKFNGKELPMDNYYYVIDLYGDGKEVFKGNLTIVK